MRDNNTSPLVFASGYNCRLSCREVSSRGGQRGSLFQDVIFDSPTGSAPISFLKSSCQGSGYGGVEHSHPRMAICYEKSLAIYDVERLARRGSQPFQSLPREGSGPAPTAALLYHSIREHTSPIVAAEWAESPSIFMTAGECSGLNLVDLRVSRGDQMDSETAIIFRSDFSSGGGGSSAAAVMMTSSDTTKSRRGPFGSRLCQWPAATVGARSHAIASAVFAWPNFATIILLLMDGTIVTLDRRKAEDPVVSTYSGVALGDDPCAQSLALTKSVDHRTDDQYLITMTRRGCLYGLRLQALLSCSGTHLSETTPTGNRLGGSVGTSSTKKTGQVCDEHKPQGDNGSNAVGHRSLCTTSGAINAKTSGPHWRENGGGIRGLSSHVSGSLSPSSRKQSLFSSILYRETSQTCTSENWSKQLQAQVPSDKSRISGRRGYYDASHVAMRRSKEVPASQLFSSGTTHEKEDLWGRLDGDSCTAADEVNWDQGGACNPQTEDSVPEICEFHVQTITLKPADNPFSDPGGFVPVLRVAPPSTNSEFLFLTGDSFGSIKVWDARLLRDARAEYEREQIRRQEYLLQESQSAFRWIQLGEREGRGSTKFLRDHNSVSDMSEERTADCHLDDRPAVLSGHEGWIWDMCFSSDGRLMLSASSDGSVKLWNMDTHTQLDEFRGGGASPPGLCQATTSICLVD